MAAPSPSFDTPGEALAELLAGNRRFVAGERIHPNQDAEHRAAIAAEQRPFAVLFGCSDSRLAAEIIFDRGLGDLFVVRTAGHVLGAEALASIEYGVTVLAAPLIVVLGHDSCGAIQATRDALNAGYHTGAFPIGRGLRPIIDRVKPSLRYAEEHGIADVTAVHIQHTVDMILRYSQAVADLVTDGRCDVVGLSYHLADGRTTLVNAATPRS
jgi:carbonic anhydrase